MNAAVENEPGGLAGRRGLVVVEHPANAEPLSSQRRRTSKPRAENSPRTRRDRIEQSYFAALDRALRLQAQLEAEEGHVTSRSIDAPEYSAAAAVAAFPGGEIVTEEPGQSTASQEAIREAFRELFTECGTGKRSPGVREFVFYALAVGLVIQSGPFAGLDPEKVSAAMNRFKWDEKQIREAVGVFCKRTGARYPFSRKPLERGQNSKKILDPAAGEIAA